MEGDLSTSMAGLQLQQDTQQNLLHQRAAEAVSRRGSVQPLAPPEAPLAAPVPQRVSVNPPPVAAVQSPPVPQNQTWNENMPIVFGGAPNVQTKAGAGGTWDPSHGVKFGK